MTAARRKQLPSDHTWFLLLAYAGALILFTALFALSLRGSADRPDSNNLFQAGGILVASLAASTCSLVGCYLVLRRMSLLGDAISHAALPGIAVAYLFSHQLGGWPMVLGAFALGVLMAVLAQTLHGVGRLPEDVSIGVAYTGLFALGVIMVSAQSDAHLDVQCALFGHLEFVTLDVVDVGNWEVPRAALTQGGVLLVTVVYILVFWKELKLVAFDAPLARAMGLPVMAIHLSLMGLVAGAAVASFEAVGSILVVAMLIVPAATAHLICDRLAEMLLWAVALSVGSAVLGYAGALHWNTNAAGMISVVAGGQLVIALLAAPRHGILSRVGRNLGLALRIAREDILGRLFRAAETGSPVALEFPIHSYHQRWVNLLARWQLFRSRLIESAPGGELKLTTAGHTVAQSLVRAHRLWEAFLEKHFDLPVDHLHDAAERMEHFLGAELQAELNSELAGRAVDPHGKAIPDEAR